MKNNINLGIIVAFVIGLLVGYVVYPFIKPADKQTTQSQGFKTVTQTGWETFKDEEYGISFDYPSSWILNQESQIFENGDIVAVDILGETQEQQTEFYDGGGFTVMTPVPTDDDLDTWVNKKTSVNDQVSDVNINGVVFKKIYTCGLGCSTYYYTIINGTAYGINTLAEGAKKTEYQATIDQMLQTFVLPN